MRKETEEERDERLRRAMLVANSPLSKAKRKANAEPSGVPFMDRETAAGTAEWIAQNAPTVGAVGGGILGGVAGGLGAGIGTGLGTSLTGPAAVAAGLAAGAGGAAGGATAGGMIGGGVGQLVGNAAQGYVDEYQEDLDKVRLEEEARRAHLLQLLAMV